MTFESVIPNPKLKLLDQLREVMRLKHYSIRKNKTGTALTFKTDGHWNRAGHQAVAELLSEYLSTPAGR